MQLMPAHIPSPQGIDWPENHPFVEPISTVACGALMQLLEPKSRIRFVSNQAVPQPRSGYQIGSHNFQGWARLVQNLVSGGADREDLGVFKTCIKVIGIWLTCDYERLSGIDDSMERAALSARIQAVQDLLNYLKAGLEALQKTYELKKSTNTQSAIGNWITDIQTACSMEFKPTYTIGKIEQRIKYLWLTSEIEHLNTTFKLALEKQGWVDPARDCRCAAEIKAINDRMAEKNEAFRQVLQEANPSAASS